jgi:nitrate/nitrite transporter NarK
MKKILSWFNGRKVYFVSVFFAVFNLLMVFNYVTLTPEQVIAVDGVFVALFGASFRSAIKK